MGGGGGAGGGGAGAVTNVRLNAAVVGLGPIFNLKIELTNGGTVPLLNLAVCIAFNTEVYRSDRPSFDVPLLLPNVTLTVIVKLTNIHPEGIADSVRAVLVNPKSSVPFAAALITMPMSELPAE